MYTLYYSPGAASFAVHLALLEIGTPYELRAVDLKAGQQKSAEYLKLNPNGLVPALVVDDQPYSECAALLMLLAERHPDAELAPLPGAPGRALYLQWMLHLANTVQPAFRQWFYPADNGPAEAETAIKEAARLRLEAAWNRLDTHLITHGPYVLGANYSVADILATMLMRWSRNMPKPATQWPALAVLAAHVKARPAWKKLYAAEGLTEWM